MKYKITPIGKLPGIGSLPYSIRVLLENVIRNDPNNKNAIEALLSWGDGNKNDTKKIHETEINFTPARILMQDFTGVPAIVDLAALRESLPSPEKVNPIIPVDLVIDHSVTVQNFGSIEAFEQNMQEEFLQNKERYQFLKWGQRSFKNFRVVPPGKGIVHQINLENLASVVFTKGGEAYPDTLLGTDSHTTMINGLSVLAWGVGGIEAEAALLGLPTVMLIPEVVGVEIKGELREGVTATDLVLTITELLRNTGVVSKFVEFHGEGLSDLPVADRATIANMAPEYGATVGFFPIDEETISYLRLTGREEEHLKLVEEYAKEQLLWAKGPCPRYSTYLTLDLSSIVPSLAGPKRPQDRVALSEVKRSFENFIEKAGTIIDTISTTNTAGTTGTAGTTAKLTKDGDVVIAAITSCTNTSNPSVMIAAGLLARKARERGLTSKPWVKTSLAPGSQVVTEYLIKAGLLDDLEKLGFHVVGYGCTTCIGNSGPLPEAIAHEIIKQKLTVCSVLSGNRNFEGRVHPLVKTNYLASPPLVVAYALAGTVLIDLEHDPIANGVYLKDLWPSNKEIKSTIEQVLSKELFREKNAEIFVGPKAWEELKVADSVLYPWDEKSTYIMKPPFLDEDNENSETSASILTKLNDILGAKILALFGDSITTDHISPAGSIKRDSPAGLYLEKERGIPLERFNSYGSRRGHHQVMVRGTFANVRLKNAMVPGIEGGFTRKDGKITTIYKAAMDYQEESVPLVIFAGKEYGAGSSRDWAAKGPRLLGVRAIIAESFERIHRSNLVGMGILPFEFTAGQSWKELGLTGEESISITNILTSPTLIINKTSAINTINTINTINENSYSLKLRVDTDIEFEQLKCGGILSYAKIKQK
ncbi:MAG: aconitate hydratase AcnA [Oligoflexia bacterium]|nr:aconitate hydratase AcnA [Oligoflexia bacterium]